MALAVRGLVPAGHLKQGLSRRKTGFPVRPSSGPPHRFQPPAATPKCNAVHFRSEGGA